MSSSPPVFAQRHLLGIEHLDRLEIEALLDLADEAVAISRQVEKKRSTLRGRTQINLFFEASTRTQSSFELAGKRLGADVMNMAVGASSVKKGETLIDTAMTLNAMRPDILVVRHHAAGAVSLLARKVARFFSTWREIATASSERSRRASISRRERCSMPSRWRWEKIGGGTVIKPQAYIRRLVLRQPRNGPLSSAEGARGPRERARTARLTDVVEADASRRRKECVARGLGLRARRRLANVGEEMRAETAPALGVRARAAKEAREGVRRRGDSRSGHPSTRRGRGMMEFLGGIQDCHGGDSVLLAEERACCRQRGEPS